MVTLSLGQWVTLYPEEKLLRVLTLWGVWWGGAGEDFGCWGPGGGTDLRVTLPSLMVFPMSQSHAAWLFQVMCFCRCGAVCSQLCCHPGSGHCCSPQSAHSCIGYS